MSTYDMDLMSGGKLLEAIDGSGEVVTGPLKLSQKFGAMFLTKSGSVLGDPDYGTNFMIALDHGELRTDIDVVAAFNEAVTTIMMYWGRTTSAGTPSDEILATATLEHYELAPPGLLMYIKLITAAGLVYRLSLPVTAMGG